MAKMMKQMAASQSDDTLRAQCEAVRDRVSVRDWLTWLRLVMAAEVCGGLRNDASLFPCRWACRSSKQR